MTKVDENSSVRLARSILGADLITPEEVSKAGPIIVYTNEQITALVESLPSEDVLSWCKKNDYAVIPSPPKAMSLTDVWEIRSTHFYLKTGGLYPNEDFAHEDKTSFGWLAIKKAPVFNSTRKTWDQQNTLLSALEYVPNAAEMSWFITTCFEVRATRLFESGIYVRTSSIGIGLEHDDGRGICRATFGHFSDDGFDVAIWGSNRTDGRIGLSAARKFT